MAADRRWGPGGGGRDAPSSFCSSRRRRRRPPECGRGLRGMSVQYGREPRPLPSAPPLGFSCRLAHNPGAAVARRLALLPLARAAARPAGPAHSGPLGGGVRGRRRGRGGSAPRGACAQRPQRHEEPAGAGNLEGAGGRLAELRELQLLRWGWWRSSPLCPSCDQVEKRGWGQKVHSSMHVLGRRAQHSGSFRPSFVTPGSRSQFLAGKNAGKGF